MILYIPRNPNDSLTLPTLRIDQMSLKMKCFAIVVCFIALHMVSGRKRSLDFWKHQVENAIKGLDSAYRKGRIAFSARQSATRTYQKDETWIFDTVLVNDGNAYNKATGTFTAPVGGTYAFTWATLTSPSKAAHPYLRVNGRYKGFTAFNNIHTPHTFWSSGSNTILVRLKKADKVNIASGFLAAHARDGFTSFSGWKIF